MKYCSSLADCHESRIKIINLIKVTNIFLLPVSFFLLSHLFLSRKEVKINLEQFFLFKNVCNGCGKWFFLQNAISYHFLFSCTTDIERSFVKVFINFHSFFLPCYQSFAILLQLHVSFFLHIFHIVAVFCCFQISFVMWSELQRLNGNSCKKKSMEENENSLKLRKF